MKSVINEDFKIGINIAISKAKKDTEMYNILLKIKKSILNNKIERDEQLNFYIK